VSAKFRRPWVGPWRIIERSSRLNYVITDQREKQLVVHVNRLKRAHYPVEWQVPKREKARRKVRPKRRQTNEEGDQELPSSGPIPIREPQVENLRPAELRNPDRNRQVLDTPRSRRDSRELREKTRPSPSFDPGCARSRKHPTTSAVNKRHSVLWL
jgi:hypothetical protein